MNEISNEIWQKYEKSKSYMDSKGIMTKTEKNWQFYIGRQWEACDNSEGLEDLPMMNFIKPTVKYKVSTIAQHSVSAMFSDMNGKYADVTGNLNKLFDVSWEKAKMDRTAWEALKHSAIQGDSYVYWFDGDTRQRPQLIHNTQIKLGDENITDIQEQPWLIIEERLSADVVRERAKAKGVKESELDNIQTDSDMTERLLNKTEVKDKVTSLLYMEKKDGIVHIARSTKNLVYEELHPIRQRKAGDYTGQGLTKYPIVSMIWEEVPNSARGTSEVEQLIPNQLELNKTIARRTISVKTTAYPRLAYDDSSLANPEDLDKIGAAIKLNGGNAQAINNMISYLAPQAMSQDAKMLSDELLEQTRSLAGASDVQLGQFNLSRVSGTAVQTVRDQQQVPLNEQVSMYQDFIENVALLWFDMWCAYNPVKVEMNGIEVLTKDILAITPNVRVDIVENTTLSKMAAQQELTNLFNNNKITFEEWVDSYPEHSSIPKEVLIKIVNARKQQAESEQVELDENGNPLINNDVSGEGVKTGGISGSSYQGLQSQLAQNVIGN